MEGNRGAAVSTQAFQVFWDWLEAEGEDVAAVRRELADAGWPEATLLRRGGWVDLDALVAVEQAVRRRFPERDDLFFDIGGSVGRGRGLGFLRTASRTLVSPHLLYRQMPGMMRRFLFRFFTLELRSTSPETMVGEYRFNPGCPPSDAFLETARGVLSSMPVMLGASPADVRLERSGALTVDVAITFRAWSGPVERAVALITWPFRRVRLLLTAQREAGEAVLETNRLLMERVAEVDAARSELAGKVRDLEALRANLAEMVSERTAELETARAQLEDSVRQLERANAGRSAFFTNVSHEFKTPLTLMLAPLGELEQWLDRTDAMAQRDEVRGVRRNAQSLLRLINEILDFARLDADRMPVRPAQFDLGRELGDALATLRPLAEARRMALTFAQADAPVTVRADRGLLTRAVVNLVVNAVKYCPEGAHIDVSYGVEGEEAEPGDVAWVRVSDDGPGIPLEQQSHIFERFGRAADGTGRPVEGSGIGLAMVAEILALHGGAVTLESEAQSGARFTLRWPRLDGLAEPAQPAAAEVWATPAEDAHGAHALTTALRLPEQRAEGDAPSPAAPTDGTDDDAALREAEGLVLIVEDNPELRRYMARVIGRRYGVLTAPDGAAGVAVARERLPDLVLSDVMMPVLDGYGLCRALKADPTTARIPVLLITARHGDEAALAGFEAEADDFIRKPFSAPELLARIGTHLRVVRLRHQLIRSEKSQLMGTLSAGLAHEVLNPVNALLQSVRLLKDTELDLEPAERVALLDAVQRGGVRIERIVRAVQEFARHDAGRLQWRPMRMSACLDELSALLGHRLTEGKALVRALGDDPDFVCQPDLIAQALTNLVVNGLAAGDTVTVAVRQDGRGTEVRVTDDGPGVPLAERDRVFAPFHTTRAPGEGTGMGLAISREIAEFHGGTLELAPPSEGGACFVLWLPRRAKSSETQDDRGRA